MCFHCFGYLSESSLVKMELVDASVWIVSVLAYILALVAFSKVNL